jgi:hypothetical protein
MRIPKNKISSSYAQAGEFVYVQNREPFSGSYYTFNGAYYTGKEYNTASLELQKVPPSLPILPFNNIDSALYNVLTNGIIAFTGGAVSRIITSLPVKSPEFLILAPKDPAQANINADTLSLEPKTSKKRYFCRQLVPILNPPDSNPIKEITETEYNSLRGAITYRTAVLTEITSPGDAGPTFENAEEIKIAEQSIPGIKLFLKIP